MVSSEAYHFRLGNFYVNGLKIPDVYSRGTFAQIKRVLLMLTGAAPGVGRVRTSTSKKQQG